MGHSLKKARYIIPLSRGKNPMTHSLVFQSYLVRIGVKGPTNTSFLKAFGGFKHLLTRYLGDLGRLG